MFKNASSFYKFWFILTLSMGFSFIFIIPPFHSPDEYNHFFKIYHITDGHFIAEIDRAEMHIGGYIPKSLTDISRPFEKAIFKTDVKISKDTILSYLDYPLSKNATKFVSFPNTARYAPTAYLPQIITIGLLKTVNIPPLIMLYIGRLVTFLFWFFIIIQAIRLTPVGKELLMCLALLPCSVVLSSSVSADVVTNACVFLIFALFFRFRYAEKPIPNKELHFFALLLLITSLNKICYFPLLFLMLFVKEAHFGSRFKKWAFIASNLLLNTIVIGYWVQIVQHLIYPTHDAQVTTYSDIRPGFDVNPTLQMQHILQEPILFLKNFIPATFHAYNENWTTYISFFGWDGLYVPTGLAIPFAIIATLFFSIQNVKFKILEKIALICIAHSMTTLFILSMHLHWDGVGDEIINYYMGKYYIPIYPLIFWAFSGVLYKYREFFIVKLHLYKVLAVAYLIIYADMWVIAWMRYYV